MEDGDSTSGGDELEDPHSANLLSYLLDDVRNFDIDDVYEEENERLDCDSAIDGDKIDDLQSTCAAAKKIKERYKEEEDVVMGDPWRNGVLIEKAGDPKIS